MAKDKSGDVVEAFADPNAKGLRARMARANAERNPDAPRVSPPPPVAAPTPALAPSGSPPQVPGAVATADPVVGADPKRWLGLMVIAVSQLMIVVDATIVNVALPAMATDLKISEADRQWVVTAYTLAFGGLLLLGGRVADYLGRRTTFIVGLLGFAGASALGGAANNLTTLLAARGLQGLFGALLAPAALALVTTMFMDPHERAKAFAIFGAVAGGGSAVGLILGGVLTEYLNWRWTMFVNIPIALGTFVAALALLPKSREKVHGRLDLIGAVLATGGLVALVYSFSEAARKGWTDPSTLFFLGLGLALLIMFVTSQRLVSNPLLPLRILAERNRAGASIAVLLGMVAMFGVFFFLSFYMQGVLGFQPVKAGVAFLPVTGGIIVASAVVSGVGTKVAPRLLMGGGLLGAAAAMFLLVRIQPDSGYAADLLPALILIGLSLGCVFVPAFNAATIGVEPTDAGVASATVNTAQQVGGSLGIALLSTVAASHAADFLVGKKMTDANLIAAQVEGYARASLWAGLICVGAAVITVLLVNVKRLELSGFGEGAMPALETAPPAIAQDTPAAATPARTPALVAAGFVSEAPAPAAPAEPDPVAAQVWASEEEWYEAQWSKPLSDEAGPVPQEPVPQEPVSQKPVSEEPVSAEVAESDAPILPPVPEPSQDAVPTARSADSNGLSGSPAAAPPESGGPLPIAFPVRGRVRHGRGLAVEGAALTLLDNSGRQVARGVSGADGGFEFSVPEAGEFVLVARRAGHRPHALSVWVPGGAADVEVTLFGAAALVGAVVGGRRRAPVPGALVTLADRSGDVVASVRTDAVGEYEISELTAGTFTLVVTTPSCRPTALLVEVAGDGRTRQDVEVAGAATLTGVARSIDGRLVVDARVSLADSEGNVVAEAFTGEDGRYEFTDLVEGDYTLLAVGYPPSADGVTLDPGQAVAHEITLAHAQVQVERPQPE